MMNQSKRIPWSVVRVITVIAIVTTALSYVSKAGAAPADPFVTQKSGFTPYVVAFRTLDTRGHGGSKIPAGGVAEVLVDPVGPIQATAAVFNLTVTEPDGPGYLTAYECGSPRPVVSNLNYVKGQTTGNLVHLKVSTSPAPRICVFTQAAAHIIVDMQGSFNTNQGMRAKYLPAPVRKLDTRNTPGLVSSTQRVRVSDDSTSSFGRYAVVAVTITEGSGGGFGTIWGCSDDQGRTGPPLSSNINWNAGVTVANTAYTRMSGNDICVYLSSPAELVIDVLGYYNSTRNDASFANGDWFVPVDPFRAIDTRNVGGLRTSTVVPIRDGGRAVGVITNTTVTEPQGSGFVLTYSGGNPPLASNGNFVRDQTVATAAYSTLSNGSVTVYTSTAAHHVLDVQGYIVKP